MLGLVNNHSIYSTSNGNKLQPPFNLYTLPHLKLSLTTQKLNIAIPHSSSTASSTTPLKTVAQ